MPDIILFNIHGTGTRCSERGTVDKNMDTVEIIPLLILLFEKKIDQSTRNIRELINLCKVEAYLHPIYDETTIIVPYVDVTFRNSVEPRYYTVLCPVSPPF